MSWPHLVLFSAVLATVIGVSYHFWNKRPRLAPKLLPLIEGIPVDNHKWGSYRSHTYFGLRMRDPKSPLFGVMWYEQPNAFAFPHLRHWCDQGDGIPRYAWVAADGRSFGKQNLTEKAAAMRFDWVNHEDTFTARISIDALKGKRYSVILYLASQDEGKLTTGHHLEDVLVSQGGHLGNARLSVKSPQIDKILHSTMVWDEPFKLNQLNDLVLRNMGAMESKNGIVFQFNQEHPFHDGHFAAVQLNVGNKVELEISLSTEDHQALSGSEYTDELNRRLASFNEKFEDKFHLNGKGYTQIQLDMGRVALSNMLGSIGYWYGSNKVARGHEIVSYGPHSLFSAVPSRPFFPRGFLWDEGFHNMLISKFDPDLTVEILTSWLNMINEDGWIPREQILGEEAEAKVPDEYIVQKTNVANPPSLFYVFDRILEDDRIVVKHGDILAKMYPKLERWYNWLSQTQRGKTSSTFRWRGRNSTTDRELNPKTLASGLDDYPRASHPSRDEYHLDLRCWMAVCSRVMARLAALYGQPADQKKYFEQAGKLSDYKKLVALHWDEDQKIFCDYGKHSHSVQLVKEMDKKRPGEYVIKRKATSPQLGFVNDVFGYNSLYPVMMKLVPPDAPELGFVLEKVEDREHLWTDFGLRSVSKQSPYYAARNTEHDPPYWRGYIWINMNYMMLSALHHYANIEGPFRETSERLMKSLRHNLVTNMAKEFNRTGYLWEHYDDRTGEGRGTQPFTGWSSLVLLIMDDDLQS